MELILNRIFWDDIIKLEISKPLKYINQFSLQPEELDLGIQWEIQSYNISTNEITISIYSKYMQDAFNTFERFSGHLLRGTKYKSLQEYQANYLEQLSLYKEKED